MNKYHELMINTSNICKKNNVDDWELIISDSVSVSANSFKHEIIKEASSFSSALSIRVIKNGKGKTRKFCPGVNDVQKLF